MIGRIGWLNLSRRWDPDQQERGRKYGYEMTAMKALAIVRAGPAVTVTVPESQRSWMWLDYERGRLTDADLGTHRVVFRPCPRTGSAAEEREHCVWEPARACRSGLTQFNGGIALDYDNAPHEGRCARLIVRVEGQPGRQRKLAFPGRARRCKKI